MWATPVPEERERLLAEFAHRFPLPVRIPVIGDRGARLELSFLLGNPTGSLRVPPAGASPAFSKIIRMVTLAKRDEGDDDELVRDCVLWPSPALISSARNRWPKIVQGLSVEVSRKIGLTEPIVEVAAETAGDRLAAALASHPRAVLRRFAPPGDGGKISPFVAVIDSPDRVRYDVFVEAMNESEADLPKLVREFADGILVMTDGPTPDEVCDRWPGTMLQVVGVALRMAGASGSARLGEW